MMKKLISLLLVFVMMLSFSTVFADTQLAPVDMSKITTGQTIELQLGKYDNIAVICERYPVFD